MRNTCIIPSCHQDIIHRALEQHFKLSSSRFQPISSDRYQSTTDGDRQSDIHLHMQGSRRLAISHAQCPYMLACIMSVRVHVCSYACMRNAFRWAPHPPTQPHNSLSDRPPEIYVPTPPLNGSVSSLYIHTHIQVLGTVCNTTSTCTQIEDCERRGHFHFSRRHCWSPDWNTPLSSRLHCTE